MAIEVEALDRTILSYVADVKTPFRFIVLSCTVLMRRERQLSIATWMCVFSRTVLKICHQ